MLIGGVDEAGRGSVIGPLIVAGIAISDDELPQLKDLGVRDSKKLSPNRRRLLALLIRNIVRKVVVEEAAPQVIDSYVSKGKLNLLELELMVRIISRLSADVVYIDAPDINVRRFTALLTKMLSEHYGLTGIRVIAEHEADVKFPVVSAASIIAKVYRDSRIADLHTTYGDFGSGYPSDPKTIRFLKDVLSRPSPPPIIRRSWRTITRIQGELKSRKLRLS